MAKAIAFLSFSFAGVCLWSLLQVAVAHGV